MSGNIDAEGKLIGDYASMSREAGGLVGAYQRALSQAATPGGFVRNKHGHYFKDVAHLNSIDVYRVLELFNVTNPSIAHAAKKLLVAGGRGAGKSIDKDIQEAIDSLVRWQAMRNEDRAQDDGK
jgi:hypothetical protein